MLAGAREHDRGEPPADRHRLDHGRVHRLVPDPQAGGRRRPGDGTRVKLDREHSIELAFLAAATVYSLTLPLKHSITLIDAVVLVGSSSRTRSASPARPAEEPHLVGPARYLGTFSTAARRTAIVADVRVRGGGDPAVRRARSPHALVETGAELGISEFFLVQWLAPLASEAPELLVAGLYAWRLNTNAGLGTLVSSKVNQWTLLVGTLPIVFAIAAGSLHGLPIDAHAARGAVPHGGAVVLRGRGAVEPVDVAPRGAGSCSGCSGRSSSLGAVVPESLHGVERIAVGVVYLVLGRRDLRRATDAGCPPCCATGSARRTAEPRGTRRGSRRARPATIAGWIRARSSPRSRPTRSRRPWCTFASSPPRPSASRALPGRTSPTSLRRAAGAARDRRPVPASGRRRSRSSRPAGT